MAEVTGVDASVCRIRLRGRPDLPYDVCSFNIGSLSFGLDLPGARGRAIASRPIGRMVEQIDALLRVE